jgi:hypothetical protein
MRHTTPILLLFLVVGGASCSSSSDPAATPSPDTAVDSGTPGSDVGPSKDGANAAEKDHGTQPNPPDDKGATSQDTDQSAEDTGGAAKDEGKPETDKGASPTDGGTAHDGGVEPADTTAQPTDEGSPADTGEEPADGGPQYSIYLHDPVINDGSGDGRWSPGEEAQITVIMTNRGPDPHSWYPSARLSTTHEQVEVTEHELQLYAILPEQDVEMHFSVRAEAGIAVGTEVPFTAKVHSLGCDNDPNDCPPPAPLDFSFTIEEAAAPPTETEVLLAGANNATASYSEGGFPESWSSTSGSSVPLGRRETEPHRSYYTGLRFDGVHVPQGARVVSARLSFHPTNEVDSSNNLWINVYSERSANSGSFSGDGASLSRPDQRPRTSAFIDHWLVRCTSSCTEDTEYDCPQRKLDCWNREQRFELPKDLAELVQEVVDLPEWAAGNALTFLLFNSANDEDGEKYKGSRSIVGFDQSVADRAPLLTIEVEAAQ